MTPISLEEGRQGTPLEVRRPIQVAVPDTWTSGGAAGRLIVGESSSTRFTCTHDYTGAHVHLHAYGYMLVESC